MAGMTTGEPDWRLSIELFPDRRSIQSMPQTARKAA
jgi:hypothetical protein